MLWLWCRLAAAAVIRPLAWELPYATGVALKKANTHTYTQKNKTKKPKKNEIQQNYPSKLKSKLRYSQIKTVKNLLLANRIDLLALLSYEKYQRKSFRLK